MNVSTASLSTSGVPGDAVRPRERGPVAANRRDGRGPTLILASVAPGTRNVGEILLKEMLQGLDPTQFICATISDPSDTAPAADPSPCEVRRLACESEHGQRRSLSRWSFVRELIRRETEYRPSLRSFVRQVIEYARQRNVRRIWSILDSTTIIEATPEVARQLQVPVLAHVWDDPHHLCAQRNLDGVSRRRVLSAFGRTLKMAERVAVIGETMADHYRDVYGADCTIIRHGVDTPHLAARTTFTSPREFAIGFSGGMYAESAWFALLRALDSVGWNIAGRSVVIKVMSGDMRLKSRSAARVEFLGWRSLEDVSAVLSGCDVNYLPQPWDEASKPLAQLSFPTKLSMYVSTGRPVFVHAPPYASLPRFCAEHSVGPVCTTLEPSDILNSLSPLARDPDYYANAALGATAVARDVLNHDRFVQSVRSFLGVESAA